MFLYIKQVWYCIEQLLDVKSESWNQLRTSEREGKDSGQQDRHTQRERETVRRRNRARCCPWGSLSASISYASPVPVSNSPLKYSWAAAEEVAAAAEVGPVGLTESVQGHGSASYALTHSPPAPPACAEKLSHRRPPRAFRSPTASCLLFPQLCFHLSLSHCVSLSTCSIFAPFYLHILGQIHKTAF